MPVLQKVQLEVGRRDAEMQLFSSFGGSTDKF